MFNIRLADKFDIKNVFELSNDSGVRENSINKNTITWNEHVLWFNERIKNTDEPFYIIEDNAKNFVAQVRFNKELEGFVISISIAKNYRGKGIASKIISETSKTIRKTPIIAYVKPMNIPSKKAFIKAGYVYSGISIIKNEKYEKYILV